MPQSETTKLDPGYYWVRDKGNPSLMIREWAPECGACGMWFMAGVDGGVDPERVEVFSGKIENDTESEALACLRSFVAETVDYMTRNKLGDPERQHNVKWARAIIAKNNIP